MTAPRWAAGFALALVACAAPPPEPGEACDEGVASSPLSAVDRKIIGDAAPYVADGKLRARDGELAESQRLRREVAWQTAAKLLAQVPLAEALPNAPELPASVPAWQTWYDFDDVRRVFHRLYGDLDSREKAGRDHFSDAAMDEAMQWNIGSVDELPNWPVERYLEYLADIDQASDVAGLGGISRVGYSPGSVRHLLRSYPEVLACQDSGVPPAVAEGPSEEARVAREPIVSLPCERRVVGSYAVKLGETLRVTLEESDSASAELTLTAGDTVCSAAAGDTCELSGPAEVEVAVDANGERLDSFVVVDRATARPEWAACLDGPFPLDAAVIKADYRRADFGMMLPVHDTSAGALKAHLSGDAAWSTRTEADPGPSDIYTVSLSSGSTYRLAGLHIMTKELDHWLWVTLWWSPAPDDDFGADRPAAILNLPGPWKNYKMCAVTAFDEGDPSATGGFEGEHPSLADALAAVYEGPGKPSWCSNPYLELGHGNAQTNCIGCHQHAGTNLASEDILLFPERGRPQLRNNFPSDYSWALVSGDHVAQLFMEEEAYYQNR